MIKETLILGRELDKFGKTLVEECPDNDCLVFRNIYLRYNERLADYKLILDANLGIFDSTKRVLEHGIWQDEMKLYEMWQSNHAVKKHREELKKG